MNWPTPHPDAEPRAEFVEGVEGLLVRRAREMERTHKRRRTMKWTASLGGVAAAVAVVCAVWLGGGTLFSSDPQAPQTLPASDGPAVTAPLRVEKPLVYVYQTHNRESFLPELDETDPNRAFDKDTNITLVGKRLVDQLNQRQVGAVQTTVDYWSDGKMEQAYQSSRKTVQETLAKYQDLQIVIDLHRRDVSRERSTVTVDGEEMAKVLFVIGGGNPQRETNHEFGKELYDELQGYYSGIGDGVMMTGVDGTRDSLYNQDLHPHSLILEVGGPENTLEEMYRTADRLAEVIAEFLKERAKTQVFQQEGYNVRGVPGKFAFMDIPFVAGKMNKYMWWVEAGQEPQTLTVTAKHRLYGQTANVLVLENVSGKGQMIPTMMSLPQPGKWELTVRLGEEVLGEVVVEVEDNKDLYTPQYHPDYPQVELYPGLIKDPNGPGYLTNAISPRDLHDYYHDAPVNVEASIRDGYTYITFSPKS